MAEQLRISIAAVPTSSANCELIAEPLIAPSVPPTATGANNRLLCGKLMPSASSAMESSLR